MYDTSSAGRGRMLGQINLGFEPRGIPARTSICFHQDDGLVIVTSNYQTIQVWTTKTGYDANLEAATSLQTRDGVFALAISSTYSLVACAVCDQLSDGPSEVVVWDYRKGNLIQKFGPMPSIHGLRFHGRHLVFATRTQGPDTLQFWNIQTGRLDHAFDVEDCECFAVSSTREKIALSLGLVAQIRSLTRNDLKRASSTNKAPSADPAVTSKGGRIAVRYSDRLEVLDLQGSVIQTYSCILPAYRLAISPDGKNVAEISGGLTVLSNLEVKTRRELGCHGAAAIGFAHDNSLLAVARSNDLVLWDIQNDRQVLSTKLTFHDFSKITFTQDGKNVCAFPKSFEIATGKWRPCGPWDAGEHCGASVKFDWVQYNGKDLLWLPDKYRTRYSDQDRDTVALCYPDGGLTIMQFADPESV